MTAIVVPFHQDERQPDGSIRVPDRVLPDAAVRLLDPVLPPGPQWQRLQVLHHAVAEAVAGEVGRGGRPAVLAGDCLVALGTLTGLQRAGLDPAVVWFDAHGDLHTLASSTSGYLGGMVLRMVLGADADRLAGPLGLRPLAEQAAVLVDGRDLDPAEAEFLRTSRVAVLPADQVTADLLPGRPLLLHLDLDVVDSAELSGLRFPVPGGPGRAALLAAVARLLGTGRVAALDVCCTWYPPRDAEESADHDALVAAILQA